MDMELSKNSYDSGGELPGEGGIIGMEPWNCIPCESLSELFVFLLAWLLLVISSVFAGYYITIILHEAGHLIFGLLTGYHVLSFRVGQMVIIKQHGIHICRQKGHPSAGQCLLLPPSGDGNQYFFMLFGGILFNFFFGTIFVCLAFVPAFSFLLSVFWLILGVVNIVAAVMNSFPRKRSRIENDGLCIKNLYKNQCALQCYRKQMLMVPELLSGTTYGEMNESLFEIEDTLLKTEPADDLKNDIVASMYLYQYYRHIELGEYEQAFDKIRLLIRQKAFLNDGLAAEIGAEECFCREICEFNIKSWDLKEENRNKENNRNNEENRNKELKRNKEENRNKEESWNPYKIRIRAVLAGKIDTGMRELSQIYRKSNYKGEVRFNQNVLRKLLIEGRVKKQHG